MPIRIGVQRGAVASAIFKRRETPIPLSLSTEVLGVTSAPLPARRPEAYAVALSPFRVQHSQDGSLLSRLQRR